MSGDAEGSSLFKGWWQLHSQDISKLDFDVQIVQAGSGGFTASFYSLSDVDPKNPQKGPAVLRVSLKIATDGNIASPRLEPVWH